MKVLMRAAATLAAALVVGVTGAVAADLDTIAIPVVGTNATRPTKIIATGTFMAPRRSPTNPHPAIIRPTQSP